MHWGLYLAWVIGVSSFTLIGSYYARRTHRSDLLIGLYVAFILTAQLLATKIATFNFGFGEFSGPAGVLVFAVTFLITDIVNERFGPRETRRMIGIAFVAQIASAFFFWLATQFDPAPGWGTDATAWNSIFGLVPRITIASWIAYLVSEHLDVFVYSWFKRLTHGRHLWLRNVVSTLPALAVDSLIFVPIAFAGVPGFPLWAVIQGQIMVKWVVGVIDIPFMYINAAMLARDEKKVQEQSSDTVWPA